MSAQVRGQLGLDELILDDPQLEHALEVRAECRELAADARARLTRASDAVLSLVGDRVPDEGALRVGRFRITRLETKPRSVQFETQGSSRLAIAEVDEE